MILNTILWITALYKWLIHTYNYYYDYFPQCWKKERFTPLQSFSNSSSNKKAQLPSSAFAMVRKSSTSCQHFIGSLTLSKFVFFNYYQLMLSPCGSKSSQIGVTKVLETKRYKWFNTFWKREKVISVEHLERLFKKNA